MKWWDKILGRDPEPGFGHSLPADDEIGPELPEERILVPPLPDPADWAPTVTVLVLRETQSKGDLGAYERLDCAVTLVGRTYQATPSRGVSPSEVVSVEIDALPGLSAVSIAYREGTEDDSVTADINTAIEGESPVSSFNFEDWAEHYQ